MTVDDLLTVGSLLLIAYAVLLRLGLFRALDPATLARGVKRFVAAIPWTPPQATARQQRRQPVAQRPMPVGNVLSSPERRKNRIAKRRTLRDIRAQYRNTIPRTAGTIDWNDALLDILVAWKADDKITREQWRAYLRCSPNTLNQKIAAYRQQQMVDSRADTQLSDAEFVAKYRRSASRAPRDTIPRVS